MRVQSLAEEARIARNAYMQADLLAEPRRTQAKELLKEYVKLRSSNFKSDSSTVGEQAGLADRRSPVASITLAVAFSAVIILITDLDRPIMSFFEINKQLLVDLSEYMETDLQLEYYPGDQDQ